jgi:transcriptional regulator with XRE-family HTH domain
MNKQTDIKDIVSQNLVKFRKEANLTQTQVAEKINYSDKAVSKWERGESLPDVVVLKQIADIYGVELDDLLHETTTMEKIQSFYRNRTVISILSVLLVWLVAMICYVVIEIALPGQLVTWLAFIYAIPVSFIIALVFNNLWGGRIYNMVIVSGLDWGVALSLVLSLQLIDSIRDKVPYLYFIAAVFEVMVILWYLLDPTKLKKQRQMKKAAKTAASKITEPVKKDEAPAEAAEEKTTEKD